MSAKKKDPIAHLTAGAISGLTSCTLLQPFDLVKTRLQQQNLKTDGKKTLNSTVLHTVKSIVENESIRGLWKGTVPTILRNVPGSALYFFTLSEIRHLLSLKQQKTASQTISKSSLPVLSNKNNLIAGMVARGTIGFVMMPITVIKVRYESNLYNYKSIWNALTSILRHEGIKGLYYGYSATVIRDAPYAGLYVLFYERWKLFFSGNTFAIASPIIHMTSAVIAGLSATTVTHPFDMIKTRMQLKPQNYPNILLGALKIFKEKGFIGFFDGLTLRMGKKTAQAAINWTIYEALITWFQQRRNDN